MVGKLINYLYPTRCPACRGLLENDGSRIHESCKSKFKIIHQPRCLKCGRQVDTDEIDICFECAKNRPFFDYGFPVFEYNDVAKMAVLDYKNKGWKNNGEYFAHEAVELIGEALKRRNPQVLIPVPVHVKKFGERGFNQAQIIADILGERLGIPVDNDCLEKVVQTKQQKSLRSRERIINSADVFRFIGERRYTRVCIVDDVFTTGSTVNSCAQILKSSGVREVGFVTVCAGNIY